MGGVYTRLIVTYAYSCFSTSSTALRKADSTPVECSPTALMNFSAEPMASVVRFMPVYYPRAAARLVSCYALFE